MGWRGQARTTEILVPKQVLPAEEPVEADEPDVAEVAEQPPTELLIFVTLRIIREIPRE